MSLRFVLGPTAFGKSRLICNMMADAASCSPRENFIAIVPEQSTLQMQRRVVAACSCGAAMNIDVVSFERLAHIVFDDMGIFAGDVLDDLGKILVIRRVLGRLSEETLGKYKNKIHYTGFTGDIKSQLSEFAQYGIDDNALFMMEQSAADDKILGDKIRFLREVRRQFNSNIKGRFKTSDELPDLLAKVIGKSERIRASHVYLDGFTGFTPVQFKILKEILKAAADVTVALTLPTDEIRSYASDYKDFDLFRLPAEAYFKLKEIAETEGIPVICPGDSASRQTKYHMYENLPPEVQISAAKNAEEEVLLAAENIRRLIQEDGYRYRDIAVACSDLEGCFRYIRDIFRDAEIPCFIDYKSSLSSGTLSTFIKSAVSMCVSLTNQIPELFSAIKSEITGIRRDDICLLENYCLEFGINSLSRFNREFKKNRELRKKSPSGEPLCAWDLEKINSIRGKIAAPFIKFYKEMSKPDAIASDYCEALAGLLGAFGAKEQMAELSKNLNEQGEISLSREYERVYDLTSELLLKISNLLKEEKIELSEFADILKVGLDSIKVGIIPPTLDMVTVGDVVRTRFDKPKVMILLGANAGKLPRPATGGGIFTERERNFLKSNNFEIAPSMLEDLYSQQFYIYLMLNKASDRLFVSYFAEDSDGAAAEPSYIVTDLRDKICKEHEIFEDKKPTSIELPKIRVRSAKNVYWKSRALKEFSRQIREYTGTFAEGNNESGQYEAFEDFFELLSYFAAEDSDRLYQILDGALFTNLESPLDKNIAEKLYGKSLNASVSRIESFNQCAFKHFLGYGLNLSARPEYKIEPKGVGTIYHGALNRYSEKLDASGLSFRTVKDTESDALISEAFEEEIAASGSDVFDSSERLKYQKKNMLKVLKKTVRVLRAQVTSGDFNPEESEQYFRIKLSDKISFGGIIDRMDIYDAGDLYIRIIDYKSGTKKFDVRDVYTGLSLQLPAYLTAALEKVPAEKNAVPAGIYYYRIADGYTKKDEYKTRFRMDGPTNNMNEVCAATDKTIIANGGKSDVVNLKYEKGVFKGDKNMISSEQFSNLLEFTRKKIIDAGEEILEGNVEINPYIKSGYSPCGFCEFADVCKFEPVTFDGDYRDFDDIDLGTAKAAVYDGKISPYINEHKLDISTE